MGVLVEIGRIAVEDCKEMIELLKITEVLSCGLKQKDY